MEPSGRNRWQPVANGMRSKTAQTGQSATDSNPMVKSMFATACQRLPTIPYLLERESTSWLCKERSSPANPKGPQDSARTLTGCTTVWCN
jgi:hypothetical protein